MSSPARSKWTLLAVVFALALFADQASKFLAVDRLTTLFSRAGAHGLIERIDLFLHARYLEPLATPPYYVYRPLWRMNYVENPFAAFGMFGFIPAQLRYQVFIAISILAIVFVFYYYRRLEPGQRFLQISLAFVLAGTVGNLIDRLARRYVIDFVEWYWWNRPDLRWPTFNVADSLLVVGIAMLLVHPSPKQASARGSGNKRAISGV
jgi:signal peptidase II